jgi:hypothetical protein
MHQNIFVDVERYMVHKNIIDSFTDKLSVKFVACLGHQTFSFFCCGDIYVDFCTHLFFIFEILFSIFLNLIFTMLPGANTLCLEYGVMDYRKHTQKLPCGNVILTVVIHRRFKFPPFTLYKFLKSLYYRITVGDGEATFG